MSEIHGLTLAENTCLGYPELGFENHKSSSASGGGGVGGGRGEGGVGAGRGRRAQAPTEKAAPRRRLAERSSNLQGRGSATGGLGKPKRIEMMQAPGGGDGPRGAGPLAQGLARGGAHAR